MNYWTSMNSPLGSLLIVLDEQGALTHLDFAETRNRNRPDVGNAVRNDKRCVHVVRQLKEYFAGKRRDFDLKVMPEGTEFQCKVWKVLQTIPYGQTISYGEQARRMGNPNASRAVGAANGTNPIAIILPCHRVIGSSGALVGYASGIERKRWLLEHEGALSGGLDLK
ncbi:MAG: methylated-DNA--[protein]-cysteine S-methyltransferase [bacterium]